MTNTNNAVCQTCGHKHIQGYDCPTCGPLRQPTDHAGLVERLHACRISAPETHPVHPKICDEAAAAIETLQGRVADYEERMSECISPTTIDGEEWTEGGADHIPLMRGSPNLKEFIAFLHQSAHNLQADRDKLQAVLETIGTQTPEKPDYWSACGQCERNIDAAEQALETDQ